MNNDQQTESGIIEKEGIEPIPAERRTHGPRDIGLIFVGIFSHLLCFVLGAQFVVRVGLPAGLAALVLGIGLVFPFYLTGGWISSRHGLPGSVSMRIAFGSHGSWIPSIGNAVVAMGWFALQTTISAKAFDLILITLFGTGSHEAVWIVVWGIIYCFNAVVGFQWITRFARLAVPALYVLFAAIVVSLALDRSLSLGAITAAPAGGLTFALFLTLTDSVFGGWGGTSTTLVADYCRYARSRSAAALSAWAALGAALFIVTIGGVATVATGESDIIRTIFQVIPGKWGGLTAMGVVMFATWTTNPCNTYSAGLSLSNVTGWSRVTSVALMGVLGISLALWGILGRFIGFLEVVGVTLCPANVILMIEYFLFARGRVEVKALYAPGGIKWAAVTAWAVGTGTVALPYLLGKPISPAPAMTACLLAAVVYTVLRLGQSRAGSV